MDYPFHAPSAIARFRWIMLAGSTSILLACSGSTAPAKDGDPSTATGTSGGPSAGGSDNNGTGGGSSSGGSDSSGGATSMGGTTTVTTTGGTGGAAGASSGGMAGAGTAGTGNTNPPGAGYTVAGYNNATWAGGDTTDTIVVNANGYLPMAASDCPKDPDMAIVLPYKDKIFNGCLDECFGDPDMTGHGKATVFDWNVKGAGWAVGQLSSTLHWTGMWAPTAGAQPTTLVFWIRGDVGGEQAKLTVAIHSHLSNTLSAALKLPITVTTGWQRVVIPWDSFKVPASPYPDALAFSATGAGKVTFFIDQAYLSKTVKAP